MGFWRLSGAIVANPTGEQRGSQEGSAEKEDPDAELAGEAGEALFFNEGFAGPPYQGAQHEENDEQGGKSQSAAAFAAGLLLLHDTNGCADNTARAIGDGRVAVGLKPGYG